MRTTVVFATAAVFALCAAAAHAEDDAYIRALAPAVSAPAPSMCGASTKDDLACDMQHTLHVPRNPVASPGSTRLSLRIYASPPFANWTVMQFDVASDGDQVRTTLTVWNGDHDPHTARLGPQAHYTLLQMADMADLLAMPATRKRTGGCIDSIDYTVEVTTATDHHWFTLQCGAAPDPHQKSVDALVTQAETIARAALPELGNSYPD